jgi:hypothetical protein
MRVSYLLAIAVVSVACSNAAQVSASIPLSHRTSVDNLLSKHPEYRAATPEDCQCNEDIESVRHGDGAAFPAVPEYQPYVMQGDFDGDGVGDVAIVAMTTTPEHKIVVRVSIGNREGGKAVFQQIQRTGNTLAARGLFCARPYPANPA